MPAVPTADSMSKLDSLFSFFVPTMREPKSSDSFTFDRLGSSFSSPIERPAASNFS